jgi:hypothetical protein
MTVLRSCIKHVRQTCPIRQEMLYMLSIIAETLECVVPKGVCVANWQCLIASFTCLKQK